MAKEYYILIAQLEHQLRSTPAFSLQKLWFYLHPTLNVLSTISSLIRAIGAAESVAKDDVDGMIMSNSVMGSAVGGGGGDLLARSSIRGGGVVLCVIADRMLSFSGDPTTKQLYAHLLSQASIPYFSTLRSWIHRGEIVDPYDEFMVVERRGMSKEQLKQDINDVYWSQRYTLRSDSIPPFLAPFKEKILLAG
ncbi:hypothetical protein HK102_009276, partial [Quaeritorhiza haematococci]